MQSTKSRPGPDPLPLAEKRRFTVGVSFTEEELEWVRKHAGDEDRPVAAWARRRILRGYRPSPK